MFKKFPVNIVPLGWQEAYGEKPVFTSNWCSIKYCFRHLFMRKHFELNILYPRMLEKYIITILT